MDKKTFYRVIAAARRISRYYGPRLSAKDKCKVDTKLYECSKCGKYLYEGNSLKNLEKFIEKYPDKDIHMEKMDMDHISPVVAVDTVEHDWNVFFERLFCPEENWRGLCKECHKKKTGAEQKVRLAIKYGRKKK